MKNASTISKILVIFTLVGVCNAQSGLRQSQQNVEASLDADGERNLQGYACLACPGRWCPSFCMAPVPTPAPTLVPTLLPSSLPSLAPFETESGGETLSPQPTGSPTNSAEPTNSAPPSTSLMPSCSTTYEVALRGTISLTFAVPLPPQWIPRSYDVEQAEIQTSKYFDDSMDGAFGDFYTGSTFEITGSNYKASGKYWVPQMDLKYSSTIEFMGCEAPTFDDIQAALPFDEYYTFLYLGLAEPYGESPFLLVILVEHLGLRIEMVEE